MVCVLAHRNHLAIPLGYEKSKFLSFIFFMKEGRFYKAPKAVKVGVFDYENQKLKIKSPHIIQKPMGHGRYRSPSVIYSWNCLLILIGLNFFSQIRHELEDVFYNAHVGHLEYGGFGIFVHCHDERRALNSTQVLK